MIKNLEKVQSNLNGVARITNNNRNYRRNLQGDWQQDNASAEDNPIEKKKTLSKIFTVNSKDRLSINNQHGDVKIELWDKNEIKVDITITGYGTSEVKAQ